jgi:hypothetical protein
LTGGIKRDVSREDALTTLNEAAVTYP